MDNNVQLYRGYTSAIGVLGDRKVYVFPQGIKVQGRNGPKTASFGATFRDPMLVSRLQSANGDSLKILVDRLARERMAQA